MILRLLLGLFPVLCTLGNYDGAHSMIRTSRATWRSSTTSTSEEPEQQYILPLSLPLLLVLLLALVLRRHHYYQSDQYGRPFQCDDHSEHEKRHEFIQPLPDSTTSGKAAHPPELQGGVFRSFLVRLRGAGVLPTRMTHLITSTASSS